MKRRRNFTKLHVVTFLPIYTLSPFYQTTNSHFSTKLHTVTLQPIYTLSLLPNHTQSLLPKYTVTPTKLQTVSPTKLHSHSHQTTHCLSYQTAQSLPPNYTQSLMLYAALCPALYRQTQLYSQLGGHLQVSAAFLCPKKCRTE